jgi:homoserine kinase
MIRVQIPATTANLGAGFDCMGMALDLWNTFELRQTGSGEPIRVKSHGEGADILPQDETNLIAQILREKLGEIPTGLEITCHNEVPCASGLGSSSTATLAGLVFAKALSLGDLDGGTVAGALMDRLPEVLGEAVEVEGHGDNVAPAVLGGLQIVYTSGREFMTRTVAIPPIRVVVCVPDFLYLTSQARAALPKSVTHKDAVFNIGRAMLTIEALRTGDEALLADAMQDRLHENYRLPDIPGAIPALAAARKLGATAAALSGAGPGVIAFAKVNHEAIGQGMVEAFALGGLQARYWILDASPGMTIANLD